MATIQLKLEGNERKHCNIMIDFTRSQQSYIIYNIYLVSKTKNILQISLNQYSIFKEPYLNKSQKQHLELFCKEFLPLDITKFLLSTNKPQRIYLLQKEKEDLEQKIIDYIERSIEQ